MPHVNPMRRLFNEKPTLVGVNVVMREPVATEFLAQHFDYIWLDYEHTWMNRGDIINHLIAARAGGDTPVVIRVPSEFPPAVKPLLDMGPAGIVFPMISTVEQARTAIAACTYAPRGARGFCPMRVTSNFNRSYWDYAHEADEHVFKILQIESRQGVENIDEILRLPGVDGVAVGPADMSATIGRILEMGHPEMIALLERLCAAVAKAGLPLMTNGPSGPDDLRWWRERGARAFTAGSDMGFMMGGAEPLARGMRQALA